jgi:hypothetical protein
MYYLILIAAVIIGQTFTAAYLSWKYQTANDLIDYPKAFKLYINKNIGTFAVIVTFTLIVLFVLSDWMDMTMTKQQLLSLEKRTRFQEAQLKFRTVAIVYGVFAQLIASLLYKGGELAIKNYGKQKGIDTDSK